MRASLALILLPLCTTDALPHGRASAFAFLWKRDEAAQEVARRRSVGSVDDVCGLAERVACDGRRGDDVRLRRARAEEVRPARIAVARAAVAVRGILRKAQP